MTLFGVSFLVAGMLTCFIPIGLLVAFATFFHYTATRLPPNATPPQGDAPPAEGHFPDAQA